MLYDFGPLMRSNLHTHTNFSDGKHSAEEVVRSAVAAGMDVIGFSEHSYNPGVSVYGMKDEATVQAYRAEIRRLQDVYGDRIKILLGIEQDSFGSLPMVVYDYIIGSVHYVLADGEYCAVDHSRERMENAVKQHFGGDIYRYIRAYYHEVAQVVDKTQCDIVGHFDLVTKFNEGGCMFDENDIRYRRAAVEAIDALIEKDIIFEVNTGAISRGYRTLPYPSSLLLQRIREKGGTVTLNSDAHHKDHLTYCFDQACKILHMLNMPSVIAMTPNGWKSII